MPPSTSSYEDLSEVDIVRERARLRRAALEARRADEAAAAAEKAGPAPRERGTTPRRGTPTAAPEPHGAAAGGASSVAAAPAACRSVAAPGWQKIRRQNQAKNALAAGGARFRLQQQRVAKKLESQLAGGGSRAPGAGHARTPPGRTTPLRDPTVVTSSEVVRARVPMTRSAADSAELGELGELEVEAVDHLGSGPVSEPRADEGQPAPTVIERLRLRKLEARQAAQQPSTHYAGSASDRVVEQDAVGSAGLPAEAGGRIRPESPRSPPRQHGQPSAAIMAELRDRSEVLLMAREVELRIPPRRRTIDSALAQPRELAPSAAMALADGPAVDSLERALEELAARTGRPAPDSPPLSHEKWVQPAAASRSRMSGEPIELRPPHTLMLAGAQRQLNSTDEVTELLSKLLAGEAVADAFRPAANGGQRISPRNPQASGGHRISQRNPGANGGQKIRPRNPDAVAVWGTGGQRTGKRPVGSGPPQRPGPTEQRGTTAKPSTRPRSADQHQQAARLQARARGAAARSSFARELEDRAEALERQHSVAMRGLVAVQALVRGNFSWRRHSVALVVEERRLLRLRLRLLHAV